MYLLNFAHGTQYVSDNQPEDRAGIGLEILFGAWVTPGIAGIFSNEAYVSKNNRHH